MAANNHLIANLCGFDQLHRKLNTIEPLIGQRTWRIATGRYETGLSRLDSVQTEVYPVRNRTRLTLEMSVCVF